MKKKQKALITSGILACLLIGGTVALSAYSGRTDKVENTFNLVEGPKDQSGAGTILEPTLDSTGSATAAAGPTPNQIVPKDPYIRSNMDWAAWTFMKVEVPIFTEAPNTGKETATLLNVNADGKWTLISDITSGDTRALIYGYNKILPGNNSTKTEEEQAKTSSLFNSFQIADGISLDSTYTGSIKVTGTLVQSQGYESITDAATDAGMNNKITYILDGGTITGEKKIYTAEDAGYVPLTPTKEGYTFVGWDPESLPVNSKGQIAFTAKWMVTPLGTIQYNLDGGVMDDGKVEYIADDYGYVPPTPSKVGYKFIGWNPESLPINSTGNIEFTAKWEEKTATLFSGKSINGKMKRIAGGDAQYNPDNYITKILHSTDMPTSEVMADSNHIISTDDSEEPVYIWFEDGAIKWYADAKL